MTDDVTTKQLCPGSGTGDYEHGNAHCPECGLFVVVTVARTLHEHERPKP